MADNIVNVLDWENFIRQFMVEQIKKSQPEMDTSENSSFDDIFVKPMIAIASQMMQTMSLIEYRTNLKYAEALTEDQINDIGENNYAVTRASGNNASAVQVFKFSNVGSDGITIPAGVVVTSNDGFEFYTKSELYFTKAEVIENHNPLSGQYELSAIVYAAKPGSAYNKGANTINICNTSFNSYLVSTTNPSAATGGTDAESVSAYVERMRTYYSTQHLGSKPGYAAFVSNAFPSLSDVVVIGKGDEAMQRDIIRYIPSSCVVDGQLIDGWNYQSKHIGGCVDIYVRGSEYKLVDTNVVSESRYLLVDGKVESATAKDSAGNNYDCQLSYVENGDANYNEVFYDKTAVIIGADTDFTSSALVTVELVYESGQKTTTDYVINPSRSIDVPSPISQLVVSAAYTDASGNTWDNAMYSQWKKIIGANNPDSEKDTEAHEDCVIKRTTISGEEISGSGEFDQYYIGSTQEQASVILSPYLPNTYSSDSTQMNLGGNVVITTSYNVTLNEAADLLNLSGNRIITGDVLMKEAESIKVNVAIEIKLSDSDALSELRRSQIHSVISSLFDSTPIGGVIEQSDIVGELYTNTNTKSYIKYVRLPLKQFYCTGNNVVPSEQNISVVQEEGSEKKILTLTESAGVFEINKDGDIVNLAVFDKGTGATINIKSTKVDSNMKTVIIELPTSIEEGSECTVKYNALYNQSLYEGEETGIVMPDYVSATEDKYLALDNFSVTII